MRYFIQVFLLCIAFSSFITHEKMIAKEDHPSFSSSSCSSHKENAEKHKKIIVKKDHPSSSSCSCSSHKENSEKHKWLRAYLRAYLATYPRCANHWTRSVVEEATHIATGAVYRDKEPIHLRKPFAWGGYAAKHGYEGNCRYPKKGEIVLIKTHYPAKPITEFDLKPSVKIIRITRHPVNSFYSHFLHAGNQLPSDGKIPHWHVKKSISNWYKFEKYWNSQPNVCTFRYEDLLEDPYNHFRKLIKEIGYNVSEDDIKRAVDKFPPYPERVSRYGAYHPGDLKLISKKLGPLMRKYDYEMHE